jgi:hypothetical protein
VNLEGAPDGANDGMEGVLPELFVDMTEKSGRTRAAAASTPFTAAVRWC